MAIKLPKAVAGSMALWLAFAAAIADLRSKLPPQSKMAPQLKRARGGKDHE